MANIFRFVLGLVVLNVFILPLLCESKNKAHVKEGVDKTKKDNDIIQTKADDKSEQSKADDMSDKTKADDSTQQSETEDKTKQNMTEDPIEEPMTTMSAAEIRLQTFLSIARGQVQSESGPSYPVPAGSCTDNQFTEFDKNGDGQLTLEEAFAQKHHLDRFDEVKSLSDEKKMELIAAVFAKADADHDNKVSRQEYVGLDDITKHLVPKDEL